jgi:hypothetical protein
MGSLDLDESFHSSISSSSFGDDNFEIDFTSVSGSRDDKKNRWDHSIKDSRPRAPVRSYYDSDDETEFVTKYAVGEVDNLGPFIV